jgi:hypothetical protein
MKKTRTLLDAVAMAWVMLNAFSCTDTVGDVTLDSGEIDDTKGDTGAGGDGIRTVMLTAIPMPTRILTATRTQTPIPTPMPTAMGTRMPIPIP